jgi:hypothetical protein
VRPGPFLPADLDALDGLLSRGHVAPMETIADGLADLRTIGMRHDCDNVIEPAVQMAEWEARRGYCSTYYILHTSPYWQDKPLLRHSLNVIASHNDAITVALETGRKPADILREAIDELRGYGHTIRSTVAHGNRRCHKDHYVNDEMFAQCYREGYGGIDRLGFMPVSLHDFGLDFDANWLPRGDYLSDSGGEWSRSFHDVAAEWPEKGQLHMLVHPDWWADAFAKAEVAA